jgi:hypothetical protein
MVIIVVFEDLANAVINEVEWLGITFDCKKDIFRLQIAMDDAFIVDPLHDGDSEMSEQDDCFEGEASKCFDMI